MLPHDNFGETRKIHFITICPQIRGWAGTQVLTEIYRIFLSSLNCFNASVSLKWVCDNEDKLMHWLKNADILNRDSFQWFLDIWNSFFFASLFLQRIYVFALRVCRESGTKWPEAESDQQGPRIVWQVFLHSWNQFLQNCFREQNFPFHIHCGTFKRFVGCPPLVWRWSGYIPSL